MKVNLNKSQRTISMCMAALTMVSGILTACSTSVDASPVPTTNNGISLIDIEGHWATSAIQQAIRNGYVDGYEDQTFKPDQVLSRAEFTKMTVTALKLPVSGSTSGKDWYLPYVNAAVSAGIHKWSDLNTGDWNTPMTRYEMARMASRAVGQATEDEKQWMYLAAKAGLVQGMDETGTLAEDGTTTRAQSVTIIERILDVKAGKELPVDKYATSSAEILWHKTNIETMLDGVYIDVEKTPESKRFNPNLMSAEVEDGVLSGWADGLYVIDLDDPNDPNRKYLSGKSYVLDSDRKSHLPMPNGAYALVSLNGFQINGTYSNLLMTQTPHLEVATTFTFANTESVFARRSSPVVDGKLQVHSFLEFISDSGESESARGVSFYNKPQNYSRLNKDVTLLPKLDGHSDNRDYFDLSFYKFSDFGQKTERVASYELVESRKRIR